MPKKLASGKVVASGKSLHCTVHLCVFWILYLVFVLSIQKQNFQISKSSHYSPSLYPVGFLQHFLQLALTLSTWFLALRLTLRENSKSKTCSSLCPQLLAQVFPHNRCSVNLSSEWIVISFHFFSTLYRLEPI